jgi:hypothetical protein
MKRPRTRLIPLTVLVALAVGYVIWLVALAPGVHVTVRNTGQGAMRETTLHVTGRAYRIGDLASGSAHACTVSPTSESHIELEFTDERGQRPRLEVGCYFEPGYRGRIDIEVRDGKVVTVKDDSRTGPY